MIVRLYGSADKHRIARREPDPRILWTACGIRCALDSGSYKYAQKAMGRPEPTGRCKECFRETDSE